MNFDFSYFKNIGSFLIIEIINKSLFNFFLDIFLEIVFLFLNNNKYK